MVRSQVTSSVSMYVFNAIAFHYRYSESKDSALSTGEAFSHLIRASCIHTAFVRKFS